MSATSDKDAHNPADSREHRIVILCGLLLSLGAFSIDITLPFFSQIAASLMAPTASMHATVTWYIFMLGVGQLVLGTVSDRIGRKPTLYIGLSLFVVGALVCSWSQTLPGLLAGRLIQGFGGAAGAVIGRAILRDLYSGTELARQMALAMAIFSIGPIIGPMLGVALVSVGGSWEFIFIGVAGYAALLIVALIRMPETLTRVRADALRPAILLTSQRSLWLDRQSRFWMVINAIMMTTMILIISQASLIYQNLYSINGAMFALLFALHGVGIIIGQSLNRWLIRRIGVTHTSRWAVLLALLSTLGILLPAAAGSMGVAWLTLMIMLFATCFLPVISNSFSLAINPHGSIAGFASAYVGSLAQLVSGLLASLLALWIQGRVVPWAASLSLVCLLVGLLLWLNRHETG